MALASWALLCSMLGMAATLNAQDLRMNHIQVKGTHNSYHQQPGIAFDASHKYTHLSLTDQLEKRALRAFELDVHRPSFGSDLVVYHIAVIDSKSSCAKFKDCLGQLKAWSDLHPQHVPITVWIEIKDGTGGPKFDNFDRVDQEIVQVLGDRLITPDSLQQNYPTLQTAVKEAGWPLLDDVRGKFIFMLDNDDRTPTVYLRNNSLNGRVMFPRAAPETIDSPWAVITKASPGSFHSQALARNFLVSDNVCGAGDNSADCQSRLQSSRQAGTHMLMDDFEGDDAKHSLNGYFVNLLEPFAVNCNRALAPLECQSSILE